MEKPAEFTAQCFGMLTCVDDWDPDRYTLVRVLQPAESFKAHLELRADVEAASTVVVKRYTQEHLRDSPEAFRHMYPWCPENPWNEVIIAHRLGKSSVFWGLGITPYRDVFRDASGDVLVVSDYMPLGDLFDFIGSQCEPGATREARIQPILQALLSTVSKMHYIGVAHRDLSVENVLLKEPLKPDDSVGVVVIDFTMAVCGEEARAAEGVRGKPQYQAPELHEGGTYDAFAADLFACGVVAFSLALGRYPWLSTAPGVCESFRAFQLKGFGSFLRRWPVPGMDCVHATDVLSPGLMKVIATLLSLDPTERRAALGMMPPSDHGEGCDEGVRGA